VLKAAREAKVRTRWIVEVRDAARLRGSVSFIVAALSSLPTTAFLNETMRRR